MAVNPLTIDIGAVYAAPPQHLRYIESCNVRTRRELVFDIDLNDYDSIRFCNCVESVEKTSCDTCWLFIDIAVQVMDYLLEHKFGIVHRFWVFSGSKGVHCWVLDSLALNLSREIRQYMCNYLGFCQDSDYFECPIMRLCYEEIVFPFFKSKVFPLLPRDNMLQHFADYVKQTQDTETHQQLCALIEQGGSLRDCVQQLDRHTKGLFSRMHYPVFIFRFLAPRLDQNVTVTEKHLLKSPFAIHKRTQALALPMSGQEVRQFSPSSAITLQSDPERVRSVVSQKITYLREVIALAKRIPEMYVCSLCTDSDMKPEDLHSSMIYDFVDLLVQHFDKEHPKEKLNISQNTLEFFIARQSVDVFGPGTDTTLELNWRRKLQDMNLL